MCLRCVVVRHVSDTDTATNFNCPCFIGVHMFLDIELNESNNQTYTFTLRAYPESMQQQGITIQLDMHIFLLHACQWDPLISLLELVLYKWKRIIHTSHIHAFACVYMLRLHTVPVSYINLPALGFQEISALDASLSYVPPIQLTIIKDLLLQSTFHLFWFSNAIGTQFDSPLILFLLFGGNGPY